MEAVDLILRKGQFLNFRHSWTYSSDEPGSPAHVANSLWGWTLTRDPRHGCFSYHGGWKTFGDKGLTSYIGVRTIFLYAQRKRAGIFNVIFLCKFGQAYTAFHTTMVASLTCTQFRGRSCGVAGLNGSTMYISTECQREKWKIYPLNELNCTLSG
jgi:hypothetical protein